MEDSEWEAKGRRSIHIAYHPYGKIIVDDAVGDGVAILLFVIGDHVNLPPVKHYLCTVLNVFQDFG